MCRMTNLGRADCEWLCELTLMDGHMDLPVVYEGTCNCFGFEQIASSHDQVAHLNRPSKMSMLRQRDA